MASWIIVLIIFGVIILVFSVLATVWVTTVRKSLGRLRNNIQTLADEIKKGESEKISSYNEMAQNYNSKVENFPSNFVAQKFGFSKFNLLEEEKMLETGKVLYTVLEAMRHIAIMLYPYCPNIAEDILTQLNEKIDFKYENLYWGGLKSGKITEKEKIKPVFLRLDSEFATDKKKG